MTSQVNRTRNRRNPFLIAALIVVIFGFVLLLVGFVAPGWVVASFKRSIFDTKFHTGLYYGIVCSAGDCETESVSGNRLPKYRAMTSISLLFAILGLVFVAIILCHSKKAFKLLATVFCFISGVLAIFSASLFGNDIWKDADGSIILKYEFPYALFLFGVGGILMIIAFILLIICMEPEDGVAQTSNEQELQVSEPQTSCPYPEKYQGPISEPYLRDPYPVKYQQQQQPIVSNQYEVIRVSDLPQQQQHVYTHAPVHNAYPRESARYYSSGRSLRSPKKRVIPLGGL